MILDLLEIWSAVAIAFAIGAFAGSLLHDWLARSRLAEGQAALAGVVAMGVEGSRRGVAARRARSLARVSLPRGRRPLADAAPGAPLAGQLDRIKGLDPAVVATLAGAGYARLDQVAGWSSAEQAWIADMLAAPQKRVGRWVARAQTILRRERAALEAPPPPERRARKARRGGSVALSEPVQAGAERAAPRDKTALEGPVRARAARTSQPGEGATATPTSEPAKQQPETPGLTPYEIALDLKLREP